MTRHDDGLRAFNERVAMKYQLYNGLFLGLPFEDLADTGVQLPLFANLCREKLQAGKSPEEIVESFFREMRGKTSPQDRMRVLFKFLQLVERQVVLFDALEDAAFAEVNDLDGPGSLAHFLGRVREQDRQQALSEALADYRVRIVLTAHPTQFYPDSILGILTDLARAIAGDRLAEIHSLLLQMGKTRFQNRQRPTPLEEARSLIWYLEHIFYFSLPAIQDRLTAAMPQDKQDPFALGPKIEMGFWPGGDRDGNPYVTSETTLQVAMLLRASILNLYAEELERLLDRLTFDGIIQPLQAIRDRLRDTPRRPGASAIGGCEGPVSGVNIKAKPDGQSQARAGYASAEELLAELRPLRAALVEQHQGLFLDRLDAFIHKVAVFGFHFAAMDLRQDSRVHGHCLEEIFNGFSRVKEKTQSAQPSPATEAKANSASRARKSKGFEKRKSDGSSWSDRLSGYAGLDEAGKFAFLEACIAAKDLPRLADPDVTSGPEVANAKQPPVITPAQETLATLRAMRRIQQSNGTRALNRYVISNSQSARNVLEVLTLARFAGWEAGSLDFDVIPLFETIDDLDRSESIMRRLYASPAYAEHLRRRGNAQTIMLGFSDGTKDGGYITANWAIHKAKRDLTRVSREAGIRVAFFDGRGGPPARGGGNTHKFYRSMGADIEHHEIQLTIQGQTISSNFGTPEAARYNLEQLFTAGLEDKIFPPDAPDLRPADIQLLERLSAHSREAYLAFRTDPLFLPYLEEMTPLSYYSLLNIASRPTRRKSASLRFEDLRAIPFVGAWSQMKQNIPGFYGVAAGLARMLARSGGDRRRVEDLFKSSLFFRTLLENAMMSLSKSYFPLTRYLEKDKRYGVFWRRIYKEATESKRLLKEVTGQHKLLETNLAVRESIHLRERIILPLLVIQQYAMRKVNSLRAEAAHAAGAHASPEAAGGAGKLEAAARTSGKRKAGGEAADPGLLDAYAKMVVKAMAANINAARNSA